MRAAPNPWALLEEAAKPGLGVLTESSEGGEDVKSLEWHRAVKRYVLPRLNGRWQAHGALLYPVPFEWLWPGLVMSTRPGSRHFSVVALTQLLVRPFRAFSGISSIDLQRAAGWEAWVLPESLEDAGPVMEQFHERIVDVAMPFFEQHDSLTSCVALVERKVQDNPESVRDLEALFYLRVLTDDLDQALPIVDTIQALATVHAGESPWIGKLVQDVVRVANAARNDRNEALDILREYAEGTRAELKIRAST
ncbi:hypothetical protein BJY16_006347 [Actinoplanes octamycinicus]|uniref:Uncharacterized protein n=1 Tax=Actinoplanes octamycinicus TaxID=135948 RepID=A0A7W7H2P3_9ACTN|nr:hypothetical protein [Actinoplanes octamycinicus]MBB4742888.1 hypothetical protein [Actinoplanes octamycinicus]GIE58259.1 hypothetical protein Aoc01nite_36610 [Actinoplanes octamycinicus]